LKGAEFRISLLKFREENRNYFVTHKKAKGEDLMQGIRRLQKAGGVAPVVDGLPSKARQVLEFSPTSAKKNLCGKARGKKIKNICYQLHYTRKEVQDTDIM
jgi:hypothetical protein